MKLSKHRQQQDFQFDKYEEMLKIMNKTREILTGSCCFEMSNKSVFNKKNGVKNETLTINDSTRSKSGK